MRARPEIRGFFDEPTNTITYLVWDPATLHAAVIDPVLDYDLADGAVDTTSAERVLAAAEELGLTITHVLETHAHADHLSAAPFFKARTGAKIGIGARIRDVQKIFRPMFCADDVKTDGSDFDLLLGEGDRLSIGWRERGGPPVRAPGRRGFGLRMIERALAADLSGAATLAFAPDGLVCRIEASLADAAPRGTRT